MTMQTSNPHLSQSPLTKRVRIWLAGFWPRFRRGMSYRPEKTYMRGQSNR